MYNGPCVVCGICAAGISTGWCVTKIGISPLAPAWVAWGNKGVGTHAPGAASDGGGGGSGCSGGGGGGGGGGEDVGI